MIRFTTAGSTRNTENFLDRIIRGDLFSKLNTYGRLGVDRLRQATPIDSGLTAASWGYEIEEKNGSYTIWWTNTNEVNGFNVAIGLQYGHGTGTGGWVAGRDYINPALKPILDKLADEVWKEVQKA